MKLIDAIPLRSEALRRLGRSERTITWYEAWLLDLNKALQGPELKTIKLEHLRRWIDGLIARELTPATIHGAGITARVFFRWCVVEGLLKVDPSLRLETMPIPRHMPETLSVTEVLALINAAARTKHPARDQAIVAFLFDTGCRRAGLLNLTLDKLRIEECCAFVIEKGNRERPVFYGIATRDLLDNYLKVRFPWGDNVFNLGESGLHLLLNRLGQRCGIKVNPHKFRKTAATALAHYLSTYELQARMGWADSGSAQWYVSMAGMESAARAISPMDSALRQRPAQA